MANADSVTQPNGLSQVLNTVDDWATHSTLKTVKKYRVGRHRFYIRGRHTDCNYIVCHILVNKKDADDTPGKQVFKDMIMESLATPVARLIEEGV